MHDLIPDVRITSQTFLSVSAMLVLIVFFLPATSLAGRLPTDDPLQCGRSALSFVDDRIVGGDEVFPGDYPWQVALSQRNESGDASWMCGGSLINPLWVVTAAHCVVGGQGTTDDANGFEVGMGSLSDPDHLQERRRVVRIVAYPWFSMQTMSGDIALLRLEEPVVYGDAVGPICLPREDFDMSGHGAVVTGWGLVEQEGNSSDTLKEVMVKIFNNEECDAMFELADSLKQDSAVPGSMKRLPDTVFCAGAVLGGADSCQGDSGGPLAARRTDGRFTLIGVVSYGDGCAQPLRPGVYTKVAKFVDWIDRIIREDAEGASSNNSG